MNKEDKGLLLKDLGARICYRVILEYDAQIPLISITRNGSINGTIPIEDCKPYLRPISSMTEEERKYYNQLSLLVADADGDVYEETDWLNAHHFDYRGLIEKGLALEAPEGMYKTE